jgi:hypothetical protein
MNNIKIKLNRLMIAASGLKDASSILLKAQETLDKASEKLALASINLKAASDYIRLSNFKDKIYLEDIWEITVIFQEEKNYIALVSAKNIETGENFKSLRFDIKRQVFLEAKQPLLSSSSKATLAQALSILAVKDVKAENKVLN